MHPPDPPNAPDSPQPLGAASPGLPARYPTAAWHASPNHTPGRASVAAVVVHISQGSYQSGIDWLTAPASKASAHAIISPRGEVAQMVGFRDTAWANGLRWPNGTPHNARGRAVTPTWKLLQPGMDPNRHTIAIELAGFSVHPRPAAQVAALVKLLRWIAEHAGLRYVVGETLIGHAHLDNVDRAMCPGPHVDLHVIARATGLAPAPAPAPTGTAILGGPSVPATTLIAYLDPRTPHLSWQQRQSIVTSYTFLGELTTIGNLRPFAQAVKEASEKDASGVWRPFNSRRFLQNYNPAGLGATNDGAEGARFASIADGIAAQFAHLLCYAARAEELPTTLAILQTLSPRREALRQAFGLGASPTWEGLNGRWAYPGPTYGQDILRLADEIAGAGAS